MRCRNSKQRDSKVHCTHLFVVCSLSILILCLLTPLVENYAICMSKMGFQENLNCSENENDDVEQILILTLFSSQFVSHFLIDNEK